MTARQFRVLAVLTVLSGFAGGFVSSLLLRGTPAAAQTGGKVQEVVRARSFELLDAQDKVKAKLACNGLEISGLSLFDREGCLRQWVGLDAGGVPVLRQFATSGKKTVELRGADDVLFTFRGRNGAWALMGTSDGGAYQFLCDVSGIPRVVLSGDDKPRISVADMKGRERAVLGVAQTVAVKTGAETTYPESTATLFKEDGNVAWQAP